MTSPRNAYIAASPPAPISFALPMMTYFLITKHHDRVVAHALDFDLVAVGPNEEHALIKLRRAIKAHVEFGIQNDLDKDILFKAPNEFWKDVTPETKLTETLVVTKLWRRHRNTKHG